MLILGDAKALAVVIRIVSAITSKCIQPRLWFRKGLKFMVVFLSSFLVLLPSCCLALQAGAV
jgi:hypothetical protein